MAANEAPRSPAKRDGVSWAELRRSSPRRFIGPKPLAKANPLCSPAVAGQSIRPEADKPGKGE